MLHGKTGIFIKEKSSGQYSNPDVPIINEIDLLCSARKTMENASSAIAKCSYFNGARNDYQYARSLGISEAIERIDYTSSIEDNIRKLSGYRDELEFLGEFNYSEKELAGRIRSTSEAIELLIGIRENRNGSNYFPLEAPR